MPRTAWPLLVCCAVVAVSAARVPGGSLRIVELSGPGWQASDLLLAWQWRDGGGALADLEIGEFVLGDAVYTDLHLHCGEATLTDRVARCRDARIAFTTPEALPLQGELALDYTLANGALEVEVHAFEVCSGTVEGGFASDAEAEWRATLDFRALDAACLARLGGLGDDAPVAFSAGSVDGQVGLDDAGRALELDLAITKLAFGDAAGTLAGEGLDGRLVASLQRDGEAWQGRVEMATTHGVVYREPFLLDAERTPLDLRLAGRWRPGDRLDLTDLELEQGRALALGGHAAVDTTSLEPLSADLEFSSRDLDAFYATWVQPLLIGTAFDDLELAGAVRGQVRSAGAGWVVAAELEQVAVLDAAGRFSMGGLAGTVAWGGPDAPPSRLRWAGGHVLQLAVGAAETEFTLRNGALKLTRPLRQPLVDGALQVTRLEASDVGTGRARVVLEAGLEPVSLEALSYAFGWPVMAGRLGGAIPALSYADQTLSVDGALRVDVFDGTIRIDRLSLARPLGPVPALEADVAVDNLDLELLTRTFTIGRIEGRLAGRVDNLLLHDWRPVRFDAELATPLDDDSRHRISQRAVDSITSLGGLSGALSQSALRFFDEFRYSRLGFSCRLRGTVCELGGVEPAESGYYLVKGGGLPRIDIIGHVRKVDWPELVDRVQHAMEAPAPVIN